MAFPSVESLKIYALQHCDSQLFHNKPIENSYRPCSLFMCVCVCVSRWCVCVCGKIGGVDGDGRGGGLVIEQIKIIVTIDETIDQSSLSFWMCEIDQFLRYDIDCFD